MSEGLEGCAVCGGRAAQGTRMSKVVIEGRALELCRTHTATVVAAMPETFEDLRMLFVGTDRRSPIERREADDRRVFPPRPEGRRLDGGRRVGDARD